VTQITETPTRRLTRPAGACIVVRRALRSEHPATLAWVEQETSMKTIARNVITALSLTDAMVVLLEATGTDPVRDVQRLAEAGVSRAELFAECLDGADDGDSATWEDYVAVVARASQRIVDRVGQTQDTEVDTATATGCVRATLSHDLRIDLEWVSATGETCGHSACTCMPDHVYDDGIGDTDEIEDAIAEVTGRAARLSWGEQSASIRL
jgi:hypothetical protein